MCRLGRRRSSVEVSEGNKTSAADWSPILFGSSKCKNCAHFRGSFALSDRSPKEVQKTVLHGSGAYGLLGPGRIGPSLGRPFKFHPILFLHFLCFAAGCSLICPSAVAAVYSANQTFGVSLLGGAAPEPFWLEDEFFSVPASSLVEGSLAWWQQRFFARVGVCRSGWFQLAVPARLFVEMQADGQPQAQQQADGQGGTAGVTAEQADRLVRERLNQAFSSVFGKLIESSERAAAAAERQANVVKNDNLVKGLKCDQWKPQTREEELKTWREWYFGFTNFISSHDPEYEAELNGLDLEKEATHDLMPAEQVARSQRLFGLLCSLLRGRPLMLIRVCDKTKAGYEAVRILKNEMEPREKARTLALLRQLASWRFDERATMHEQLVRYEEALRTYETSSGKPFPEDVPRWLRASKNPFAARSS